MATILTKRSNTASSVPVAGDLTNSTGGAELAVNTADKRLFTKDSGGTVVELGTNPSTFSLPNGTANGVAYLNGSKVLTSGSALTFDGTNLGVTGGNISTNRNLAVGNGYNLTWGTAYGAGIPTISGGAGFLQFFPDGSTSGEQMRLTSTGLGIGTSSPAYRLDVSHSSFDVARFITSAANTDARINIQGNGTGLGALNAVNNGLVFQVTGSERARIDSSGNLLVGTTSNGNSAKFLVVGGSTGGTSLQAGFGGINGTSFQIYHADAGGQSGTATVTSIAKVASSGRSINAAGTINASGADYAEYMTKAGDFTVAKGDVVGIDSNGKLTNVFSDAVSFCVKSTAPSYVGGDTWGAELEGDELEAARQAVDRIAFAGQVPVNVLGATPGQFIIPVDSNGAIIGQAVSNPTFEQYQIAVGKVIAVESDGRARIIVKVA